MYKMRVDHMKFDDLVEMVTARGFARDPSLPPLTSTPASGDAQATNRRMLMQ
jgi:hypothetical protein